MSDNTQAHLLRRMIAQVQESILHQYDVFGLAAGDKSPLQAAPLSIREVSPAPSTAREAVEHALGMLARAEIIVDHGDVRDPQGLANVYQCVGVACGVVLPFGIDVKYRTPSGKEYHPATMLPEVPSKG